MQTRRLGHLWPVSALTIGGGGIGQVWGSTTRDESVATLREAVDAGISLIDVAPTYGDGEAERVVGEAFHGQLPEGVRVLTKYEVGDTNGSEVAARLERSLDESLERMRLDFVDLFVLHGSIVPTIEEGGVIYTPLQLYRDAVRPAYERLVKAGRIGAWGTTAVEVPTAVLEALADDPAPAVVQAITNFLDSPGDMKFSTEPARPRDIIAAAAGRGAGVMGIRVVQAGALTDRIDRELADDHPAMVDYRRAAPFRELAAELGESPASLAHRYALSMDNVDTVVLGVKNRTELTECLQAADRGPLPPDVMQQIESLA